MQPTCGLLAGIAVLVVAIATVDAISTYFSDLWLQRAGERIVHDLRTAAYAHLQRLSLGFHQRRQKGDLVTRVTADVNAVGSMFSDSLGPMVQAVMLLIGILDRVSIAVDPVLGPGVVRGHPRARRAQLPLPPPAAHGGPAPSAATRA